MLAKNQKQCLRKQKYQLNINIKRCKNIKLRGIINLMKKNVFAILAFLLLLTPSVIAAQGFGNEPEPKKITVLAPDEVVNKDYFAAGEIVEISGTVNGDVYAAGGQVYVDGVVNGDLLVAGGTVTISGEVTQNVRAAGGQITVTGNIGRNTTIAGGNIELTNTAN